MTALIIDGIVDTLLIGTEATHCTDVYGGNWVDVADNIDIGIGWTWDGEQFLPPEIEGTNEITD